jgi:hypothetical protein
MVRPRFNDFEITAEQIALAAHQCSPLAALGIKFPIRTLVANSPPRTRNESRGASVCGSANFESSSIRWAFRSLMPPIGANLCNGYPVAHSFSNSHAQLVWQPQAQLTPMRYYGAPKSPMWRGASTWTQLTLRLSQLLLPSYLDVSLAAIG